MTKYTIDQLPELPLDEPPALNSTMGGGTTMRVRHIQSRRARGSTATAVAVLALFLAACARTNVVLTSATTPVCTAEAVAEWNRVVDQLQGVKGEDPVGFYIADFPAERFGSVIDNWYPNSGYKETLCGQLHHFNVYDGSGAEMDWNNFIIPAPGFEHLITDVLPYKGGSGTWCVDDDWQSCVGENDCMEAELTPDDSFEENPWFPKSTGSSVLEGRQICAYGPWIRECVHGHRPEIHPAELTWWKERWHDADLYWLMTLQDDSNRFDTEDDFDIEGSLPPGWREWGAAPMTARFKLAFSARPLGPVVEFGIGEAFARNVVTGDDAEARKDADDATGHAIQYDGQIVLRAMENQPRDVDLGVTFTDVCRRANNTLQGYVAIITKTGVNNDGEEGYHILYVTKKEVGGILPPVVLPEVATQVLLRTTGDHSSMRVTEIDGRPALVGDLKVAVAELQGRAHQSVTVKSVELRAPSARRPLPYEPDPARAGGVVKGVPLLDRVELSFELSSNARLEATWPGLALAALVDEKVEVASQAPAGAWQSVIKAAGGLPTDPAANLKVMRAGAVRLSVLPHYAMRKDGRASLEEGSPFVERLNEVLRRDEEGETKALFGTPTPIKAAWTFEATDLITGRSVPVSTADSTAAAAKPGAAVQVVAYPGKIPNESVQISFPSDPNGIYEVRATATVTDVLGSTSQTQHRAFSHFLADATTEGIVTSLIPAVAAAAGVSGDVVSVAIKLRPLPLDDARRRDPQARRALLLHSFSLQAADDGRITPDELQSLIKGAKSLTSR